MRNTVATILTASALCGAAWAQGPGRPHHGGFGPELGMHQSRRVVTGSPYSATVSYSSVQTLSDGNTIQHTTTGTIARDSEGRTYEQVTSNHGPFGQNGPTTMTFITDPVAGYSYTLNSNTKVAFRHALKTPPMRTASSATPHRFGGSEADANRIESDLGTQVINGVNATGKTVTRTIPAGAMGNSLAMTTTSETWYSPDLQIPVLAKRSDARMGQSTYSLTNIQRAEPAASLFQVPSDYTLKDAPKFGGSVAPAPAQ